MIIFFPAGQLGNQIFQFSYLDKIRQENEIIISSRCAYFNFFKASTKNIIFLNKYFRFILRRIFLLLAKLKLISYLKQRRHTDNEGNVIFDPSTELSSGLFSGIRYVEGFFQSEQFIDTKRRPEINDKASALAQKFLAPIPAGAKKVFVHIRRGDYLDWNVLGDVDPSLPEDYYFRIIEKITKENSSCIFIFLSNDFHYVEKKFSHITNKIISKNDVATDFAIMSFCDIGVLSNSTLSWWGGYSMRAGSIAYAPSYWLGWKRKIWYPSGIETDKFNYITVENLGLKL